MSHENKKLSFWTKFFFGMGEVPGTTSKTVISILFMFYLTDVVGIIPALAGTIFMVGRVWDAFSDPMMGFITDRTRTRWGRRRPFFLFVAIPLGIFFCSMFLPYPVETQSGKMTAYLIAYILYMTCITVYFVPYLGYMAELTDDYSERTSVSNFRFFFSFIFGLFAAVIPEMLATGFVPEGWKAEVNEGLRNAADLIPYYQKGYMVAGIVIAVILTTFSLIVFFTSKERYVETKPKAKLQIFKQFGDMFKNKSFRSLLFFYVGAIAGINMLEGFVMYYMNYWIVREDDVPILFLSVVLAGVLSLPLWTLLTKKLGKKMTAIVTMLFWLITQFGWVVLKPDHPSYWVFIVGAFVGLGWGAAHVMPWAMFPDVMDQDEINTGERREGIYSGIMTFLMKMGNALAMFLIGLTLQAVNYVPNVPQTGAALAAMRLIMCFGPIVFIIIALAAAFFYPITTERYAEIRTELEKLRKARTV